MKKNKGMIVCMLFIMLISAYTVWAGTTGKIAGTVVDGATGEPLAGANVIVENSDFGAAADLNGHYTILHMPPGEYTVNVSMMGYATVTLEGVSVRIDQTAYADFNLQMEAIKGEAVTILADRTIIKKDVATSVVNVSADEVEELPVSNVNDVISMQAGIQNDFAIRGGMKDDVLFMVNGVTLRDPRNNEPITKVALSSIQEISVERGGFNAEYGQVQSGLINVVTKEGSKNSYYGSFTGKVTPPASKYYRTEGIPDVHDADSYWMRPYLDNDVCWTGTNNGAWDQYMRKQYPSFIGWNNISEQLCTDNDPDNDLTPVGAQRVFMYETRKAQINDMADYDIDAGFGGPVPFVSKMLGNLRFFTSYRRERDVLLWNYTRPDYSDYDWNLQVTSDISPSIKLRVMGLLGNVATMADNWNYGSYPRWPSTLASGTGGTILFNMFSDWAWSKTDIHHRSLSAKLTHTLNPKTFYEVSLEYFERLYDTRPTDLRDTTDLTEILPGYLVDEYPLGYWPTEVVGVTPSIADGIQASLARDNSKTSVTRLKANITSQIDFNNLLKAGIEFDYNDLNMDYGFIQMQTQGKSYGQRVQMRNFPVRAALYVQDKLETKGFTMNAGLRLDYSNSNTTWWDINPYDPRFISSLYNENDVFPTVKSKPQWQLSPRLGISHPITENSKLFFNYGHFKQMPQYETLFKIDRNASHELNRLGDPNMTLAKTISYELGYDHILFKDLLVQMAAFYRDITDQQDTTQYFSINAGNYYLTTSNNYEDIRGFEITIQKTAGRWFSGFANYTYQVSSKGNFGSAERFEDPALQKEYDEETTHLYQSHPTPSPYARVNLSLYTPEDIGPRLLGHHILGGWMMNLLLDWRQGGWITYNPKNVSGVRNNLQYVDDFNGTLRASKTIHFKTFRLQFLMDIGNMFNRLKIWNTWDQSYRQSLHLPENEAWDNIPGEDKLGDYRKPGVEWQPMEYRTEIEGTTPPDNDVPIYYEGSTGKYWEIVDGQWIESDPAKIDQILDDKAYIFNAGPSTYYFLNPRTWVFGVRISFDID